VGYINNRNVGEAYAYIVGIGDYADYQTVPFEIFELGTDSIAEVSRYAGSTRYDTSLEIAEQLKALSGSNKFNTVIVAYGNDFADALSSSYLSYVNDNAPIILVDSTNETRIKNYIDANLAEDGKVYIIGGTGVVSSKFETSLRNEAYTVKRLSGADRYLTNIEILKEANVNKEELLICSGLDYADGISASAAKKPILLVGTSLTSAQRQYLRSIEGENMILIGGTGAVTETVESELKALGKDTTTRIYGRTRYETSLEVARQLIGTDATTVTLACGDDYPDGLSGGPLAMKLGSALVIVNGSNTKMASEYVKQLTVDTFSILGGKAILPDAAIKMITRQ
jgi:putative cell wall-binding protein